MSPTKIRKQWNRYAEAREKLLVACGVPRSNRDPVAEFSEWLVAWLTGGRRSRNPVQPGWDVELSDGAKVQVKSLANAGRPWVNEHQVHLGDGVDRYALVIFESLAPKAVLIFSQDRLAEIGRALKKRHGDLEATLRLTEKNYREILANKRRFQELGLEVFLPGDWEDRGAASASVARPLPPESGAVPRLSLDCDGGSPSRRPNPNGPAADDR